MKGIGDIVCSCPKCHPEYYLLCHHCLRPYPKWESSAPRPYCTMGCRDKGIPDSRTDYWKICVKEGLK